MTEAETHSWIFYAVSASARKEGVTHREIEAVADGINHAVPTQKEMSVSLAWIESKGLIERIGKKVILTRKGKTLADQFNGRSGSMMKTWDRIASAFQKMGADHQIPLDCRTMKGEQPGTGQPAARAGTNGF